MGHAGHSCRRFLFIYMGTQGTLRHTLPSAMGSEHVRGVKSRLHETVAIVLKPSYDALRSVAGRPEEARPRIVLVRSTRNKRWPTGGNALIRAGGLGHAVFRHVNLAPDAKDGPKS